MSVAREVVPMMTSRGRGADTAAGPQRPGRVLLVEDEHDVAELIRYNLAKEGYDVVLATNGTDALRLAREVRPDVVLLELGADDCVTKPFSPRELIARVRAVVRPGQAVRLGGEEGPSEGRALRYERPTLVRCRHPQTIPFP